MLRLRKSIAVSCVVISGALILGALKARCDTILQKVEKHDLSSVTQNITLQRTEAGLADLVSFYANADMDADIATEVEQDNAEEALNLDVALPLAYKGDANEMIAEAMLRQAIRNRSSDPATFSRKLEVFVYRISNESYGSVTSAGDYTSQVDLTTTKDVVLAGAGPNDLYGKGQSADLGREDNSPPTWYSALWHTLAAHAGATTAGIVFACVYVFLRLKDIFR